MKLDGRKTYRIWWQPGDWTVILAADFRDAVRQANRIRVGLGGVDIAGIRVVGDRRC